MIAGIRELPAARHNGRSHLRVARDCRVDGRLSDRLQPPVIQGINKRQFGISKQRCHHARKCFHR